MLEWYEAYADYTDTMERIENLVAAVAQETTGTTKATFRGYTVDLVLPGAGSGSSTRSRSSASGRATRPICATGSRSAAWTRPPTAWSQLVDHAQPLRRAGADRADDPPHLSCRASPFARTSEDDPGDVTERFEYFVAGMELGNAYSELNDADEQAARRRAG